MNLRKISIVLPNLRGDGAVGMMLTLAEGLAGRGFEVDILVTKADGERSGSVPGNIRLIDLGARRTLRAVPAIARYLRQERPSVLMASEHYGGLPALYALLLARASTRCIIRQDNTWGMDSQRFKGRHKMLTPFVVSRLFRLAEIIAVSRGVANDLVAHIPHLRNNISVIYNPVVSPALTSKAMAQIEHPWLAPGEPPVLAAVGRLCAAKGFDVLIDAVAQVSKTTPVRLLILGEGPDRANLQDRIARYGLEGICQLAGYQANPYPFMRRAAAFVLSSRFEGLPTVLIETLSLGTPVIATDCPSGPREILADGKYGRLVPVEDHATLAAAIIEHLTTPLQRQPDLSDWLQQFTVDSSVAKHVALIEAALASPSPRLRNAPLRFGDNGSP